MTKSEQMAQLIQQLKQNTQIEKISCIRKGEVKDLSLINQFKLHNLLPNKWFDWVAQVDAKVMVIGQDWALMSR